MSVRKIVIVRECERSHYFESWRFLALGFNERCAEVGATTPVSYEYFSSVVCSLTRPHTHTLTHPHAHTYSLTHSHSTLTPLCHRPHPPRLFAPEISCRARSKSYIACRHRRVWVWYVCVCVVERVDV